MENKIKQQEDCVDRWAYAVDHHPGLYEADLARAKADLERLYRRTVLCVGNWPSDTGYAWRMIETFWAAISRKGPVVVTYPKVTAINPLLGDTPVVELNFNLHRPWRLARFCLQHGIGTVYLSDRPYYSLTYAILRLSGVRRIIAHDHAPGGRKAPGGLQRALKWLLARSPLAANHYIACSSTVLDRFRRIGCLPAARCVLARNGVDLDRFTQGNDIRAELNLSPDTLIVVSSSRAIKYKGIHRIIDAAAILRRERPDLRMHFVHCGDGPDFESFRQQIADLALTDHVTLLGDCEDVPEILMSADLAVHASDGEAGLPLAVLEEMAAGLPVVVTDEPTVCWCVQDGVTGLHYRRDSPAQMAARIARLLDDSALRQRMGDAGRAEVRRSYNLRDTVETVLGVIRNS